MKKLSVGVFMAVLVLSVAAAAVSWAGTTSASDEDTSGGAEGSQSALSQTAPALEQDPPALKPGGQTEEDEEAVGKLPFVGITVQTVPQAEAEELGGAAGVVVRRVLDGSAAAGLLSPGNVIVAINGQDVASAEDVVRIVREPEPGDILGFSIQGRDVDIEVTVGTRDPVINMWPDARVPDALHRMLGQTQGWHDRFVKVEMVLETDDGFKTFRAVAGNVSDVDANSGSFTLTPKDGSDPVSYVISDETMVGLSHRGDLGGLNAEDEALVVDVDGEVRLVLQPYPPSEPCLDWLRSMEADLRMLGDREDPDKDFAGPRGLPEMKERLRQMVVPGMLGQRFIGSPEFREHLEKLTPGLRGLMGSVEMRNPSTGMWSEGNMPVPEWLLRNLPQGLKGMIEQLPPRLKDLMQQGKESRDVVTQ